MTSQVFQRPCWYGKDATWTERKLSGDLRGHVSLNMLESEVRGEEMGVQDCQDQNVSLRVDRLARICEGRARWTGRETREECCTLTRSEDESNK